MKYLNSIKSHLYKEESLFESLSRFSEQTLKDIEYARSLRSDYTNKLLDKIFGYETMTVVDEEGKKITKQIPKQRIISFAPPTEKGILDALGEFKNDEKEVYYTTQTVLEMEGYYVIDPINGYVVAYREILKHFEQLGNVPMKEFPVKKKTMLTVPAPEILQLMKDWSNKRQKERGWSKKKKMKAYKNLVNRYTDKEEIEVIDVEKVTGEQVEKWMEKNRVDVSGIKKATSLYKVLTNIANNVDKKYKFKTPEEKQARKNYYLSLSERYSDIMSGFLSKGAYYMISRSAYDVAAMTEGQSWTSCMRIGGRFHKYILKPGGDISSGTLIIFLFNLEKATGKQYNTEKEEQTAINKLVTDDVPLESTMGRILIKPFYNIYKPENTDDIVYRAELESYGPGYLKEPLRKVANEFADNINKNYLDNEEGSHYVFHCGRHYDDTGEFQDTLLDWKGDEVSFDELPYGHAQRTPYPFGDHEGEYNEDTAIKVGEEIIDYDPKTGYRDSERFLDGDNDDGDEDADENYEGYFVDRKLQDKVVDDLRHVIDDGYEESDIDIEEIIDEWESYYDDKYYQDANIDERYIMSVEDIAEVLYDRDKTKTYYFIDYIFEHYDLVKEYSNYYGSKKYRMQGSGYQIAPVKFLNMDSLLNIMEGIEKNPAKYEEWDDDEWDDESINYVNEGSLGHIMKQYLEQGEKAGPHDSIVSSYLIAKCLRYNRIDLLEELFDYILEHAVKDKRIGMPLEHLTNENIPIEIRNKLKEAVDASFNFNFSVDANLDFILNEGSSLDDFFIEHIEELYFYKRDSDFIISFNGLYKKYTKEDREYLRRILFLLLETEKHSKDLKRLVKIDNYGYPTQIGRFFYFYFEMIDQEILYELWSKMKISDVIRNIEIAKRRYEKESNKKEPPLESDYDLTNKIYEIGSRVINERIKERINEFDEFSLLYVFDLIVKMDIIHTKNKNALIDHTIRRLIYDDWEDEGILFHAIKDNEKILKPRFRKFMDTVTPAVFRELKNQRDEEKMKRYIKLSLYSGKLKPAIKMGKYYVRNNTIRLITTNILTEDKLREEKYPIRYRFELYKEIVRSKSRADVNKANYIHDYLFGNILRTRDKHDSITHEIMKEFLEFYDDPNIINKINFKNTARLLREIPFEIASPLKHKQEFFNLATKELNSQIVHNYLFMIKFYLGNGPKANSIIRERFQLDKYKDRPVHGSHMMNLIETIDFVGELVKIIRNPSYIIYSYLNHIPGDFRYMYFMNPELNEKLNTFLYEENNADRLVEIAEEFYSKMDENNFLSFKLIAYLTINVKNKKWKDRSNEISKITMELDKYFYEVLEKEESEDNLPNFISNVRDLEKKWDYIVKIIRKLRAENNKERVRKIIGTKIEDFLTEIMEKRSSYFNSLYLRLIFQGGFMFHLIENKDLLLDNIRKQGAYNYENTNEKIDDFQYWDNNKEELGYILYELDKSPNVKINWDIERGAIIDDKCIIHYKIEYGKKIYDKTKTESSEESSELPVSVIARNMIRKPAKEMIKEMASIKTKLTIGASAPPDIEYGKKLFNKIVRGFKKYNPSEEELETIIKNVLPCFLSDINSLESLFNNLNGLGIKKLDYLDEIGFFDIYFKNKSIANVDVGKRKLTDKSIHIYMRYGYFYNMKHNPSFRNIVTSIKLLSRPNEKSREMNDLFIRNTERLMNLENHLPVENRQNYVLLFAFILKSEMIPARKYLRWELERHGDNSKILYMVENNLLNLLAATRKKFPNFDENKLKKETYEMIDEGVGVSRSKRLKEVLDEKWAEVEKVKYTKIITTKLTDIWNLNR